MKGSSIDKELEEVFPMPEHNPAPTHLDGWCPLLNTTQQKIFDDLAKYILSYGEKGSGKSIGGLFALVRHCYEEKDALALIIAPQIRTGKEGVIYDLMWVLDIWKNGNWDPNFPEDKRRLDDGMGLEFTEPSLDPQTKDRCIYIGNRWGGWSKVVLMSIPYAEVVEKRMKALSPSFVYVDEITELDAKDFFTYVAQQLGRRRGIRGPQQYMASCNPEGPSHWVYEVWWVDCVKDGKRSKEYSVYHVPVKENYRNLPPGYVEGLMDLYKDPIDRARLLEGRWIDRPSGLSIFKNYFRPEIHIRPTPGSPDAVKGFGLLPLRGFPIIMGYDPGPVNYSVHMLQMIPAREKVIWTVFDELNFVGQFMPDTAVVPRILRRMAYWSNFLGGNPSFVHIGDESAFTHLRHDGSYDATRLLQLSNGKIRMRPCPKGKESVPQRAQMIITMLLTETLFVSNNCPRTIEMFRLLASEKPKNDKYDPNAGLTPKRSVYLHPFDSLSYPPYYFTLHPAAFALQTQGAPPTGVYGLGEGSRR